MIRVLKDNDTKVTMTKCHFCPKSSPDGECFWTLPAHRQSDCIKAIETMTKVLNKNTKEED